MTGSYNEYEYDYIDVILPLEGEDKYIPTEEELIEFYD